ncbi:MAG TPA: MFS transporter [Xanthobacteraceae bacterium]
MRHPSRTSDGFAPRLAVYYATSGIVAGIAMPFFPLWLEHKGLDAGKIGLVLAIPALVRIFFVPLITRVADRLNALREAILITTIGAVAGHILMGFADGLMAILVVMFIAAFFFTPGLPLTDAYALRGLAERQRAYGPVRLWASAAFIAANIGGGVLIGILARGSIIWLLVAAFAVAAVSAWMLVPLAVHHGPRIERAATRSLWRAPVFVAVVVACSLVQASHTVYYGFSTLDWTAKGLGNTTVGALWALGVIAEIALFAASGFLARFLGPLALVVLGAIGGLVRWTAMAFDPPFVLLPALQCLHALSFGATHIGAMLVLARVAPAGLGATAQGDFAAAQAVIFGSAMGMSGILFRAYGDLAYVAMALLAAVGTAVALYAYVGLRGHTAK